MISSKSKLILLSTFFILPFTSASAKDIGETTATYKFYVKDKVRAKGRSIRIIERSGNHWEYTTKSYALRGLAQADQSSTFRLFNKRVKPISAETNYKILGKNNTQSIDFNSKSVVSTYKDKTKTIPMENQAYDDLSLEVQIRQDLLNGNFTGNYYMIKKDKISKTKFKKKGKSVINTPAGKFEVVRVERKHKDPKRETIFWLAPKLDYLPVRVYTKNGQRSMRLEFTGTQ